MLNPWRRRESGTQNNKGGGSVVWGLWWLQLRVRGKGWPVCLQVKAEAEAAQGRGVTDNTVKIPAPDAQTFYSLLPGAHLMSLE